MIINQSSGVDAHNSFQLNSDVEFGNRSVLMWMLSHQCGCWRWLSTYVDMMRVPMLMMTMTIMMTMMTMDNVVAMVRDAFRCEFVPF